MLCSGVNEPRLGIRENLGQFSLLVVINAFVGAMIGLERSLLPDIAHDVFGLEAKTAMLSFIVVFGLTKAATNYLAGRVSDVVGRRRVLIGGWLVAAPVPFMLAYAPSWSLILAANALLGVSQGLTWSTTVIMKIDLAGPARRGLAMGLNEFAGYAAVGLSALATGEIAARTHLRPEPFFLGAGFAAAGLVLSLFARETVHHVATEQRAHAAAAGEAAAARPTERAIFLRTSFTDRALSSLNQAGFVNNLNDGVAWGLFPLLFARAHLDVGGIAVLVSLYPTSWGVLQLFTGPLSDRTGRKPLVVAGMLTQAAALAAVAVSTSFLAFAGAALLLGAGTALVYPTLLAGIGDAAAPSWRASAVGTYRLWRDSGYAAGALVGGAVADAVGVPGALGVVAGLTFLSGVVVLVVHPGSRPRPPREAGS